MFVETSLENSLQAKRLFVTRSENLLWVRTIVATIFCEYFVDILFCSKIRWMASKSTEKQRNSTNFALITFAQYCMHYKCSNGCFYSKTIMPNTSNQSTSQTTHPPKALSCDISSSNPQDFHSCWAYACIMHKPTTKSMGRVQSHFNFSQNLRCLCSQNW